MKSHRHLHEVARDIYELVEYLQSQPDRGYLYRGQCGVSGNPARQIPRVYRACKSAEEASQVLGLSHLQTAWLFDKVRLTAQDPTLQRLTFFVGDVDHCLHPASLLATAQHYGISTELLDLTNLGPAAVFATQQWKTIHEASLYPPGHVFPTTDNRVGFIYRYSIDGLKSSIRMLGNLATGMFGARPLLQEGKVIPVGYEQDVEMFEDGVYEVFPFRQASRPYRYCRPVEIPYSGIDPHVEASFSVAIEHSCPQGLSMRDFVLPPCHFHPHPGPGGPTNLMGLLLDSPDPFMILGELIEAGVPQGVANYEQYARRLFGAVFGQSVAVLEK